MEDSDELFEKLIADELSATTAKAETALILYFRGIFAALVCRKLPLQVVHSLVETLLDT